jgi:hypothetical protein
MQTEKKIEKDNFIEVIEKLRCLTASQQRFVKEMLLQPEKKITISKKKLLKKSFGVWAGRKDISNSIEYVDHLRAGWDARLERAKG